MPAPYDPAPELAALREYDAYAEALARRDDAALHETKPSVSGWSPAQHLVHTALATRGMLSLALALAAGKPTRFDTEEPINRIGTMMLEHGLRRGGQAPAATTPPDECDAATIRRALDKGAASVESLLPFAAQLHAVEGRATHPYFGGLTATEWVRAARVHADHHRGIIDAILAEG